MDRLPLIRVAEVAFLASNVKACVDFYRSIGMDDLPSKLGRLNFASVGEQLYGVGDEKIGFYDPWTGGYSKERRLHVAFEVPDDRLDECSKFLKDHGINVSPKTQWDNFHGVAHFYQHLLPGPCRKHNRAVGAKTLSRMGGVRQQSSAVYPHRALSQVIDVRGVYPR